MYNTQRLIMQRVDALLQHFPEAGVAATQTRRYRAEVEKKQFTIIHMLLFKTLCNNKKQLTSHAHHRP